MTENVKGPSSLIPPAPMNAPVKMRPGPGDATRQLEETCRDFESIFIHHMLQQMRRTVPRGELFNGGRAEEMMTGMMDAELSKSIAQQRSLGLASILYRQLNTEPEPESPEKELKFNKERSIPLSGDIQKIPLQFEQ
jgi:Rod binding domain-containing protein